MEDGVPRFLYNGAAIASAGGGKHFQYATESKLLEEVLRAAFLSRYQELSKLTQFIKDNMWIINLQTQPSNGTE